MVYEKRIIAFIDILGFKNHIKRTINDEEYAEHLLNVMKKIVDIKSDNEQGILSQKWTGKEVSIFSDCLVISYPLDFEGGLFLILIDLIHIQVELFFADIIFRGGISLGRVYHDGNIVFGPAMVQAYHLESVVAKYPRMIIKKSTIMEGIKETLPKRHTRKQEFEYIRELLIQDNENDEIFYIDVLSQYSELDDIEIYRTMLERVKRLIIQELKNSKEKSYNQSECKNSVSVFEKYIWLKDYYNSTIKKLGITNMKIYKKDYN